VLSGPGGAVLLDPATGREMVRANGAWGRPVVSPEAIWSAGRDGILELTPEGPRIHPRPGLVPAHLIPLPTGLLLVDALGLRAMPGQAQ